ncbi:MAG: signal peptidase II [Micavibrio sp.]|nr:signal peptidase II [Micavibrio sp.]|tara:strand:- start:67 stop:591 length:525 start_codon:yes stop_codon:yes gene_type:complete
MKNKHIALILILLIVLADQLTKWWVLEGFLREDPSAALNFFEWFTSSERLPFGGIYVLPFFNLVMVWNEGVSFGLLNGFGETALILSFLSICISIGLGVWMLKTERNFIRYTLAITIGGAIGNVIDRLRFGAVADFLDIHVMGYHWPAFNLSDSAITLGVALLLIDTIFLSKKP